MARPHCVTGTAGGRPGRAAASHRTTIVRRVWTSRFLRERSRRLRRRLRSVAVVQGLINRVGLWMWRRNLRLRWRAGTLSEGADVPIDVDPRSVASQIPLSDLPFDLPVRDVVGWVLDGDWDQQPRLLSEHPVVAGIHEHFAEGREWSQTILYRAAAQGLESGLPLWKFRTAADLPRLFSKIDALYATILEEGYRSQESLGTRRLWDEVLVAVDRRGRIHLVDGAHRLAIAQVLGIGSVPALVGLRHTSWNSLRREVLRGASEGESEGKPTFAHPDLALFRQAARRTT